MHLRDRHCRLYSKAIAGERQSASSQLSISSLSNVRGKDHTQLIYHPAYLAAVNRLSKANSQELNQAVGHQCLLAPLLHQNNHSLLSYPFNFCRNTSLHKRWNIISSMVLHNSQALHFLAAELFVSSIQELPKCIISTVSS